MSKKYKKSIRQSVIQFIKKAQILTRNNLITKDSKLIFQEL